MGVGGLLAMLVVASLEYHQRSHGGAWYVLPRSQFTLAMLISINSLDLGSWDDIVTPPILPGGLLLGFFELIGDAGFMADISFRFRSRSTSAA